MLGKHSFHHAYPADRDVHHDRQLESRVPPRSGSGNGTSSFEAEEQCDDRTYRWQ